MAMIYSLRQHSFRRSETTSRDRKIPGCHTKGYACLMGEKIVSIIDAGQLCASCSDIGKPDDCHSHLRCDADEVSILKQIKMRFDAELVNILNQNKDEIWRL